MADLERSVLGRTGLEVTKLGYGAMELRGPAGGRGREIDPADAARILHAVLDAGINFIDTSPDYGNSEALIGDAISGRRDEFFLASKCGCPVDQPPPPEGERPEHVFTPENIRAGVEQSLRRMKTDHIDIVQFHVSPSREQLEHDGAVEALAALRDEGKIRFLGMSGTLPNINDHITMGVFDAFQIPYSALEREHEAVITDAAHAGAGTIIRGGVARGQPDKMPAVADLPGPWAEVMQQMAQTRRDRWEQANLDDLLDGATRSEFTLRFTLSHPHMHTTIVGTANPDHLAANVAAAAKGALPADVYEEAKSRLSQVDEEDE
jgi:aryl-alcohol dehydrogenase-like predicted oxidoreductase